MKRALLIYNPLSGQRTASKSLDSMVEGFQKQGILLDLLRLDEAASAQLEKAIKREKYNYIVAAGGDGTVGAIGSLLLKEKIKIPFAVLGTGTCNNFANNIGMPEDIWEAIKVIGQNQTRMLDVGYVNGESYFLSSLACGVFANISFETNPEIKGKIGPFAYYLRALTEITNIKAHRIKIDTGSEIIEENAYLALLFNGEHVGNFKNMLPANEIDLSDGKMELILVKESGPVEIANTLFNFAKDGNYDGLDNVVVLRSDYFKISSSDELNVSIDGEQGLPMPLEIKVLNQAIEVICKTSDNPMPKK